MFTHCTQFAANSLGIPGYGVTGRSSHTHVAEPPTSGMEKASPDDTRYDRSHGFEKLDIRIRPSMRERGE
ncbi:Hypothetical protein GbCGDNIH3_7043a [Granulibacter bethesdensis]|uniref:Uncharacterized protein n=1 Tax=Granulibacter bethesdensis TaxID=364410 RepID=A0AAN1E673_9PROT|nr:Hypothetical protein GbCGDNIH3_7043a [Granulibacter bethesdensis]